MIGLLVLALASQTTSVQRARFDLVGPLERVEVGLGPEYGPDDGRGVTRLHVDLLAGESVQLVVPIQGGAADGLFEPRVRRVVSLPGSAEFAGWRTPPADWEALPAGLRARVRPPVAAPLDALGWRALALLSGIALLVVGARRRPALALAIGVGGALFVYRFPAPDRAPAPAVLRVLEGDGPSGQWLLVESAYANLVVDDRTVLRVETVPSAAGLDWDVRRDVRRDGGESVWSASAPGAVIVSFAAFGPLAPRLTAEHNGLGDMTETWVRGADGVWSGREPWAEAAALPPADASAADPPGWLASGLPQGVGVLVGRLAPDAPKAAEAAGTPTWLRVVGFSGLDD